jgi:hypothetical protein
VLPEPSRLRRHADFSVAVRRGRRMGRRDLVLHAFDREQGCRAGGDSTSSRTPASSYLCRFRRAGFAGDGRGYPRTSGRSYRQFSRTGQAVAWGPDQNEPIGVGK